MARTPPEPAVRRVRCPGCRRPTEYSPANRWRPFCSERCRIGDLGAWASERYRVAAVETDPDEPADPADPAAPRTGAAP